MNGSACTHVHIVYTHAHVRACAHTHTHTHSHTCQKKVGAREKQKDAHFGYELLGHCRLHHAVSKSQSVSVETFLF